MRVVWLQAAATTLLGLALLSAQVVVVHVGGLDRLPSAWRYWDDLALGVARYVDATTPGPRMEGKGPDLIPLVAAYRSPMSEKVRTFKVQPHEFWRTVPDQKFRTLIQPYSAPEFEDAGRSLVLAAGFFLLGGVAPYLLLWLGVFFFAPVWLWFNYELFRANLPVAAVAQTVILSFSPYFFECLVLPHSAIGFYLAGLLALAAFSVAAFMAPADLRGVSIRSLLLAGILIVAIWCRGGSLVFVPVAATLGWIAFRHGGGLSGGRAAVATLVLMLAPVLAFRPHQAHNVWLSLWEGLGDFGTDRGFAWPDAEANAFLRRQGLPGFADPKLVTRQHEEAFRRSFLDGIKGAPLWYGKILVKRVVATVGLTKLRPFQAWDGESKSAPYFHYKYTTPIDWFGWRGEIREVPVALLWMPTAALVVLASIGRTPRADIGVLGSVAVASLPIPVLISTASGLETQAFGLTYFLGASLLLQRVANHFFLRKTVA